MNYIVKCPKCDKKVKVSTHGAVKYYDKNTNTLEISFDCPECNEEIVVTKE
jgi:endogenous inhibitor of DNA gyrase (YacG/DUF329 family)